MSETTDNTTINGAAATVSADTNSDGPAGTGNAETNPPPDSTGVFGVATDGVTLQGNGTASNEIEIKAVQHDGSMSGKGTVADPLSVASATPAVVFGPGTTNIKSNRSADQSPIDDAKTQITNFGSADGTQDPGALGATGLASTIGGGDDNTASGDYSTVAGGRANVASGPDSYAEGAQNIASGGAGTNGFGGAHAEGWLTLASGKHSHSEGANTIAAGNGSHAEGIWCEANAHHSHAEGSFSQAGDPLADPYDADSAHAEGGGTATGYGSHAESGGVASGGNSHAEDGGVASGDGSWAAGGTASGDYSHCEAFFGQATGRGSHCEGYEPSGFPIHRAAGDYSHCEGATNFVTGRAAHGEGRNNTASGACSHAEGGDDTGFAGGGNTASGDYSHAEGHGTTATSNSAHAEGNGSDATGSASHAEGFRSLASGDFSHAEGIDPIASGYASHAEGESSHATGYASHAEGSINTASGAYSHAEGTANTASGDYSHVEGTQGEATRVGQSTRGVGDILGQAIDNHCQTSFVILRGGTPGAAPAETVELGVGNNGTDPFSFEDGRCYTIAVEVTAGGTKAAGRKSRGWTMYFNVRRDAGVSTITGAWGGGTNGDALADWTLAATIAAGPDRLALTFVTGALAAKCAVVARVQFTEVLFA